MQFAHLAQRMFNTPLAIHPGKAEVVVAALAERLGITQIARMDGRAVRPMAMEDDWGEEFIQPARQRDEGFDVVEGVAVIQVEGTLVQRLGQMRPYSGMTGYDGIRQAFITAQLDPKIRAIVLSIRSPGGEVAGCFDLVDMIYGARGNKPVWAILDEFAYSAGYAIASACDVITVPRTGGVGSVGVITMHVDWSKALDAAGMKVTILSYGDRKADGAPEIPLSPEAEAAFQADINTMGELFVSTTARNRSLAPEAVRATQAACYLGVNGIPVGFADKVMAPDAAFRALLDTLG